MLPGKQGLSHLPRKILLGAIPPAALVLIWYLGAKSEGVVIPSIGRVAEVRQEVISLSKLSQEIVDMVYSFSELGFQEIWTADYLSGVLRQ